MKVWHIQAQLVYLAQLDSKISAFLRKHSQAYSQAEKFPNDMHFIKQFAGTLTKDLYNQKSCSPFKFWLQADTCQGFSKKYHNSILLKWFQSYNPAKLAVKKNMRHFGFEATFSASSYSKSLLSERPGFDSRRAQTLKTCNFVTVWSGKTYSTSFERFKLCLIG